MKLSDLKFTYNSEKQEFIPQYPRSKKIPKTDKIHSIRIGQINENYIFINMKDYTSNQIKLNHYYDHLTFSYKNVRYRINKSDLSNTIVQIKEDIN